MITNKYFYLLLFSYLLFFILPSISSGGDVCTPFCNCTTYVRSLNEQENEAFWIEDKFSDLFCDGCGIIRGQFSSSILSFVFARRGYHPKDVESVIYYEDGDDDVLLVGSGDNQHEAEERYYPGGLFKSTNFFSESNSYNIKWSRKTTNSFLFDNTTILCLAFFEIGSNRHFFAGTLGQGIWESTDGNEWVQVPSCSTYTVYSFLVFNQMVFATTGASNKLLIWSSGSWTEKNPGATSPKAVTQYNSYIYVGGNNGVYKSTNNGNNWSLLNNSSTEGTQINTIICKDGYLYAGFNSSFDDDYIKRINISGSSTWESTSSLSLDKVNTMCNDNGIIYAGTDVGIYSFNGTTWDLIHSGVKVKVLTKFNDYFFAGTRVFKKSYDYAIHIDDYIGNLLDELPFQSYPYNKNVINPKDDNDNYSGRYNPSFTCGSYTWNVFEGGSLIDLDLEHDVQRIFQETDSYEQIAESLLNDNSKWFKVTYHEGSGSFPYLPYHSAILLDPPSNGSNNKCLDCICLSKWGGGSIVIHKTWDVPPPWNGPTYFLRFWKDTILIKGTGNPNNPYSIPEGTYNIAKAITTSDYAEITGSKNVTFQIGSVPPTLRREDLKLKNNRILLGTGFHVFNLTSGYKFIATAKECNPTGFYKRSEGESLPSIEEIVKNNKVVVDNINIKINVYPNPTNNLLNIQVLSSYSNVNNEPILINIYSYNGNLITQYNSVLNKILTISFDNIVSGQYFIEAKLLNSDDSYSSKNKAVQLIQIIK